jgi:ABC-type multidrug transport system permease subunit
MGIITGIAIKDQHLAINSAPIVIIPLVLYGGLIVNLKTLPWYSGWIQYFTPLQYSYNAIVQSQL